MALKKEVNPTVVIVVIVVVVLIVGLLLWRFTGKSKKGDFNPGEMMNKYMPADAKAKMQKLAPGAVKGTEGGGTTAPSPGTGGGQ